MPINIYEKWRFENDLMLSGCFEWAGRIILIERRARGRKQYRMKKITNKITEEKTPTTTTAIWQENVRLLCVHTCAWMLLWFFFVGFCSCLVVMIAVAVSPRFVFTLLGFFSLCSHFSVRCWLENSLGWKSCFVVSVFFPFLTSSLLYSILLFSFLSSCSILLKLDGFFFLVHSYL